jgi:hypothetical protein
MRRELFNFPIEDDPKPVRDLIADRAAMFVIDL